MTKELKNQSSSILLLVALFIGAILSDCGDRASSSPNVQPRRHEAAPKKLVEVELPNASHREERFVFFHKDGRDCYRPLSDYEIQRRKEDLEKENIAREERAKAESKKEAMLASIDDEFTAAEMLGLMVEDKKWDVEEIITIEVDEENIHDVLGQLQKEGLVLTKTTENSYVCNDDSDHGSWPGRLRMASLVSVERRPVAVGAVWYHR